MLIFNGVVVGHDILLWFEDLKHLRQEEWTYTKKVDDPSPSPDPTPVAPPARPTLGGSQPLFERPRPIPIEHLSDSA